MSRLIAVFLHITSGTAVFYALGMEGVALFQYRRAVGRAQNQIAARGFDAAHRVAPLTGAATILTGVYLAQTVWGWRAAWIDTSLVAVLLVAVMSAVTAGPQSARMRDGVQSHDAMFGPSFAVRTGLLIGVLFLMTVKPPLDVSVLAVAGAGAAGFLTTARPFRARSQTSTAR